MNISKKQVLEVIRLADIKLEKSRKLQTNNDGGSTFADVIEGMNIPDGEAWSEANRALLRYITNLGYPAVFDLEVLMLFGREAPQNGSTLQDCYNDLRHYVDKPEGINEAAIYIIQKSPLSKYLREALERCDPDQIQL